MMRVAESDFRAQPHEQQTHSEQSTTPFRSDGRDFLFRGGRRTGGTSDASNRSVKPAELAQASIFKSALQIELAHLNDLASRLGGPSENLRASGPGREHPELAHIHASIAEVRRLLEGLRGRFETAE